MGICHTKSTCRSPICVHRSRYELAAYNSVFHIATLAAAAELGDAMGEADFAARCRSSQSAATKAFDTLQWNATKGAYDAGSDGCTAGVGCDSGIGVSTPFNKFLCYAFPLDR